MQKDPFMILGVQDSVSQDELYEAYREARKQWEGKRFQPGEEGTYACERLDEIEEAFRDAKDIIRARTVTAESVKAEILEPVSGDSYAEIETLLKDKNFVEASSRLDKIKIRDARWHYLTSILCVGENRMQDAYGHLKTATVIEPENTTYSEALKRMQEKIGGPQTQGFYAYRDDNVNENRRSYRDDGYDNRNRGMSPCDCCQGLICADCCCECMGGDLISCC